MSGKDRENGADVMNVKVGEIESTASVRTPDKSRGPQKVGWALSLHAAVNFVPSSLKSGPAVLLRSVSSQV